MYEYEWILWKLNRPYYSEPMENTNYFQAERQSSSVNF